MHTKYTVLKLITLHFGHTIIWFHTACSMHTLHRTRMDCSSHRINDKSFRVGAKSTMLGIGCCIRETSFHTIYPSDDANTIILGQVVVNLLWIELTCINFRSVAETLNMSPTFSRSLFPFFIPYLCGLRAHNFRFLFPATFQHLHIVCAANEPDAPPLMTMYGFITV